MSPVNPLSAKKRMRYPENHVNTSSGCCKYAVMLSWKLLWSTKFPLYGTPVASRPATNASLFLPVASYTPTDTTSPPAAAAEVPAGAVVATGAVAAGAPEAAGAFVAVDAALLSSPQATRIPAPTTPAAPASSDRRETILNPTSRGLGENSYPSDTAPPRG